MQNASAFEAQRGVCVRALAWRERKLRGNAMDEGGVAKDAGERRPVASRET